MMSDSDLLLLMVERANKEDWVAEVLDSYALYRREGDTVNEASRKALLEWGC